MGISGIPMSPILSLLSLQSCCSLVERAHTSSYRSPFSRSSPHSSTPHTTENSSRAKKTFCEMARDPTDKAKFCFLTLPTPTPTCSSSQIQAELGRSHRPPFVCGWICVCVCVYAHMHTCGLWAVHVGLCMWAVPVQCTLELLFVLWGTNSGAVPLLRALPWTAQGLWDQYSFPSLHLHVSSTFPAASAQGDD